MKIKEIPKKMLVLTNSEMKEVFDIGDKTLQKWRNEGELGFSRIGDKYYYSEDDIRQFLENHHYEAFRYD